MQPIDSPNLQPSMPSAEKASPTVKPEQPASLPEQQAVSGQELGKSQPSTSVPSVSVQSPVSPSVQLVSTQVSTQVATTNNDDLVTAGGDTIEKNWVDRADAIISQHAQDPYVEEEAHEDLSALYLKERFNLDIKRSTPKG